MSSKSATAAATMERELTTPQKFPSVKKESTIERIYPEEQLQRRYLTKDRRPSTRLD